MCIFTIFLLRYKLYTSSKERSVSMAQTGNSFIVELTPSQLGWGDERYTTTRTIRHGEGYLAIHKEYARAFVGGVENDAKFDCRNYKRTTSQRSS